MILVSALVCVHPLQHFLHCRGIELSRNYNELISLFNDRSYYSCSRRLAERGIETSPAEFDLIKDIFAAAKDAGRAAEVLKMYGHYHITEDFLLTMVQYASLLDQEAVFTEEDYAKMAEYRFEERSARYVSQLSAIGALVSLRYDIHDSLEIPYILAMAGCAAMIKERFVR